MHKDLHDKGLCIGKGRVRKLMVSHGIRAKTKREFVVITDSEYNLPVAPDLVQRRFTPQAPNQLLCGNINYIATDESPAVLGCCHGYVQPSNSGLEPTTPYANQLS